MIRLRKTSDVHLSPLPTNQLQRETRFSPPKHHTSIFTHFIALIFFAVFILDAVPIKQGYDAFKLQISVVNSHENMHDRNKNTVIKPKTSFQYVLGFSAGHTGSTTAHDAINRNCTWDGSDGAFEAIEPSEHQQVYNPDDPCDYTRDTLIPWLERNRKDGTVWVDLGHYHNLGRTLECLARSHIGPNIVFLGIQRDRYQVARSFGRGNVSPCIHDENGSDSTLPDTSRRRRKRHPRRSRRRRGHGKGRPFLSYCPHSREVLVNGPVSLPFRDDDWIKLDRFQKFLWLADEMEYRFRLLEREYTDQSKDGPTFLHISWSMADELRAGLDDVRAKLGCSELAAESIPHRKSHVKHQHSAINCTSQIIMDLEYRDIAKYDEEKKRIIFKHPQHIKVLECQETFDELVQILAENDESMENWVLNVSDHTNAPVDEGLPTLKKDVSNIK